MGKNSHGNKIKNCFSTEKKKDDAINSMIFQNQQSIS